MRQNRRPFWVSNIGKTTAQIAPFATQLVAGFLVFRKHQTDNPADNDADA